MHSLGQLKLQMLTCNFLMNLSSLPHVPWKLQEAPEDASV